jgi:hypothetical protein
MLTLTLTKSFCERKTMTLTQILAIDETRIPPSCRFAMSYVERRWRECGSPTGVEALRDMLDKALRFCADNELRYPKVLLLRLKQLERGEWPVESTPESEPTKPTPLNAWGVDITDDDIPF